MIEQYLTLCSSCFEEAVFIEVPGKAPYALGGGIFTIIYCPKCGWFYTVRDRKPGHASGGVGKVKSPFDLPLTKHGRRKLREFYRWLGL